MIMKKKALRIAAWNAAVFFVLLAALVFLPPAFLDVYKLFEVNLSKHVDSRAFLPNYASRPWAAKNFEEFDQLQTRYYDYIIWRREPFAGETINIDENGYRRNAPNAHDDFRTSQAWFFGGSTMWGSGVRDFETIPANVMRLTGLRTFNFGETGYVAHQSLNLLMKAYLEGSHPRYVVFFDGVNDVENSCRSGQAVYSAPEELRIRNYVESGARQNTRSYLLQVFTPALNVFRAMGGTIKGTQKTIYDCDKDAGKARLIANLIVADWLAAKGIVEAHGGKFVPILQPVAYMGTPNLAYLRSVTDDTSLAKQYRAVFGELRKKLATQQMEYYDFTSVFDGNELFYIDDCHFTPNGTELVAEKISGVLH